MVGVIVQEVNSACWRLVVMTAAKVCSLMRARLISSSVLLGGGALGASVGVASTHTPESMLE